MARRCAFCDDNVHFEPDEVSCENRQPFVLPLRVSVLDGDVLALDVTKATERLPEYLEIGRDKSAELPTRIPIRRTFAVCASVARDAASVPSVSPQRKVRRFIR